MKVISFVLCACFILTRPAQAGTSNKNDTKTETPKNELSALPPNTFENLPQLKTLEPLPFRQRSRFEIFAGIGPIVSVSPKLNTLPGLITNIGFSLFIIDQCQAKTKSSCIDFLIQLTPTFSQVFNLSSTPWFLGGLVGTETRIYFGAQRWAAWTVQGMLGWGYNSIIRDAVYLVQLGTGAFVSLGHGIGLSLQVTFIPSKDGSSLAFPVKLHYRF